MSADTAGGQPVDATSNPRTGGNQFDASVVRSPAWRWSTTGAGRRNAARGRQRSSGRHVSTGAGRRRPLQVDELLLQLEDLRLTLSLWATQRRQQRYEESQNLDHPARSLPDHAAWNCLD